MNIMIRLANYLLRNDRILSFVLMFCSNEKKELVYIKKFKSEFKIFGHNIDNHTDDEIKEGLKAFGLLSKEMGLTYDQVTQAIKSTAQFNLIYDTQAGKDLKVK